MEETLQEMFVRIKEEQIGASDDFDCFFALTLQTLARLSQRIAALEGSK